MADQLTTKEPYDDPNPDKTPEPLVLTPVQWVNQEVLPGPRPLRPVQQAGPIGIRCDC